MKYKLQDLIDMAHFQNLQDRLNEIYSFPSAIIDNDGHVLTATGWQDVCTQFHRKNKDCLQECVKSDQYILSHLQEASPAVSYRCPHGLVDNATPIIIDGVHYGNFFTGQFFLEKPDLEFFRGQARTYGFDENDYIEAVRKVPIWTQEQVNSYLFFIKGLIAIISESGLKKLREIETRERVEESEEHRRIILQTAMDGFWLADAGGRLLEVNETYCRISGYTVPELLTMRISDLEADEAVDVTARHIQKIITQGEDRFESKHRRKDGSEFEVEVSVQYRPTNGGRFVAFLRDITERRRTQEVLETSEAKSRAIIDASPVPMALNDEQQRITYLNPAFVATYGYAREDIPTLTHWWQAAYPDPEYRRWAAEAWQVELERAKRAGNAFSPIEVTVRCKDGVHKTVLASAASILETFQGEHVVVLYDITQRKRAESELREKEERYRILFERAPEGIFLLSLEGKMVSVNESFARMHGYSVAEIQHRDLRVLDTPRSSELAPARMRRILDGEALTFEVEHFHKDGHIFPLEVSASLITTGEATLIQCFHRDITERVRSDAALRLTSFSIEHAADALFWMTPDARIVDVNEAACRSLGYTREELLHRSVPDVDAHYNAALWPQHFAELRRRGSMTFESEQITKDGRRLQVEVVANYVEHGGEERNCAFVRDITERKRAEEQMRFSEQNLAITLQSIGDAVIATDAAGRITRMNSTAERLTGWPLADATGRPLPEVFRIVNALTRAPSLNPVQLVMERGEVVGLANHTALIARNGQEYQISDSAAPIRGSDGGIVGVVLVFGDVTEEYRVREALRKSEARFAATFRVNPAAVNLATLNEGRIVDVNERYCQFFGYSRDEVIGRTVTELRMWVEPILRDSLIQRLRIDRSVLDYETRLRRKDGTIRDVLISVEIIDKQEEAEPVFLSMIIDITERKQAVEKLARSYDLLTNLARLVPGVIYQYRLFPDGRSAFPYASPGMNDIYEVTPEEVREDATPVFGRLHPEDYDRVGKSILESARTLEEFYCEFRVVLPRQGLRWRWSQAHPQRMEDGGTLWHGIISDITERKKADELIRESLREKESLLKEVHHRVKNNLQVITSLLRMEARRSEHPATKSVLDEMKGRILSMAVLHESLYRSGTFAAVDLGAYLTQLTNQSFRALVTRPGSIQLHLEMASVQVEMDQALPCGLLVNELISNSLKHGFPDGRTGEVRVELQLVDSGPQLRLRVSDTGVGLPADFEAKRDKSLGLQLVSSLARQIDGRLEIGPGSGAVFGVTFSPKHSKLNVSTLPP